MTDRILSVDLGKEQDPTSLGVVEVARLATGETMRSRYTGKIVERYRTEYHVRHLEQLPLKTAYPRVVDRVEELLDQPELAGAHLVVDATGVGAAVVDMMRDRNRRPIEIKVTGGDTVAYDDRGYRVPKRDLAGVLQVLIPSRRLVVADGMELGGKFAKQLSTFKIKFSKASGQDTYENAKDTDHDDLVLCVAMACWYAERGQGRFGLWFQTPEPRIGSVAWAQEERRKMRASLTRQGNERGPWYRTRPSRSRTAR